MWVLRDWEFWTTFGINCKLIEVLAVDLYMPLRLQASKRPDKTAHFGHAFVLLI